MLSLTKMTNKLWLEYMKRQRSFVEYHTGSPMELFGYDLSGACLKQLDLNGVEFSYCDLRNASLHGCDLTNVSFCRCEMAGADFSCAWLENGVFANCGLQVTVWDRAVAVNFRMPGSNLSDARMDAVCMRNVDWSDTDLSRVRISGSVCLDCRTDRATTKELSVIRSWCTGFMDVSPSLDAPFFAPDATLYPDEEEDKNRHARARSFASSQYEDPPAATPRTAEEQRLRAMWEAARARAATERRWREEREALSREVECNMLDLLIPMPNALLPERERRIREASNASGAEES